MSNDGKDGARAGMGLLGSLREALAAASRDVSHRGIAAPSMAMATPAPLSQPQQQEPQMVRSNAMSAVEAAREARGGTPNVPPADKLPSEQGDGEEPPTTRVVRASKGSEDAARTQFVRGKGKVTRQSFHQDPVVAFLVVVGGPGLGAYRPIFEGNNTVGRNANQRVPIDFGDDAISAEEQAYIRYDGGDRSFLFVPNMAKTNVVAVNDKRPTSAVQLQPMDVITMGRTQLVFVPFCGAEFDWGEIGDGKV